MGIMLPTNQTKEISCQFKSSYSKINFCLVTTRTELSSLIELQRTKSEMAFVKKIL